MKDKRGAVILEFVLSCMLVMVVFMGMVNMALLVKDKLAVTAAAREAGREYAVTQSWEQSVARGYETLAVSGIGAERSQVTVTPGSPGAYLVTAEAGCESPVFFPGLSMMLGGGAWETCVKVSSGPVVFRLES